MSKHEKIYVMNTSTSKACMAKYETAKTRFHAALKSNAAKKAAKGSSVTITGVTGVEGGLKLTSAHVREIPVLVMNDAGGTV